MHCTADPTTNTTTAMSCGNRLRALLAQPGCLCLPGAFNGLVARLVKQTGFSGCYVSGAAVSAAAGMPDVGVVGLEGFCRVIREVTLVSGLPCLADADTGFGEVEVVRRTVKEYEHNGAAGLHIEDQVFPKRCGHLNDKVLVGVNEMCNKIEAAVETAKASGNGMVICARTDAREVEGMESAIMRAARYVEAGADMIFPEGLHSKVITQHIYKVICANKGCVVRCGYALVHHQQAHAHG
eukprot:GHVS01023945.1.p1 GENE.GHVS01023945.1~~GHVS01023945.1.p1  ORF type:complete len:239 (+),score=40.37 GHVS01023945.1:19-735(+)